MFKNETASSSDGVILFGNKALKFLTAVLCGAAVCVILSMIFALIMTLSVIPDGMVTVFSMIAAAGGAFACGAVAVLRIGSGGLVNGLISGILFFVVHMLLTAVFGGAFTASAFVFAAVDIVVSAVGGIAAINIKVS